MNRPNGCLVFHFQALGWNLPCQQPFLSGADYQSKLERDAPRFPNITGVLMKWRMGMVVKLSRIKNDFNFSPGVDIDIKDFLYLTWEDTF